MTDKAIILAAVLKGIFMSAIILAVAETTFIQGLLTAILSALVSGTFLLVSVHMTNKRTDRKVQEATTDILRGQEKAKDEIKEVVSNGGSK